MNLELMPASLNRAKSDKVTERARVFAKELLRCETTFGGGVEASGDGD